MSSLINKFSNSNKIYNIFLCFFIYSFMGWFIETVYMSISHGHFVKRGFLVGPLCSIYGIGALLVIILLSKIKNRPFLLFLCASCVTTVLELITGLLLKTISIQSLWDYSAMYLNFMGLICVSNTLIWGILSLFAVYIIHPLIMKIVSSIPQRTKGIICNIIFIFFSMDLTIAVYTSLIGVNNVYWISQLLLQRLEYIEDVTSKVVYYISH